MSTAVPGLIKIGKTNTNNYKDRMYNLEHNGYRNVTTLRREFAIEVENYDAKEYMLHTIFAKSRVDNTELFALDLDIAKQLLSSFEGTIVYPVMESKEEIFRESTEISAGHLIPNGIYVYKRNKKSENRQLHATARIQDGEWTLLKGSVVSGADFSDGPSRVK